MPRSARSPQHGVVPVAPIWAPIWALLCLLGGCDAGVDVASAPDAEAAPARRLIPTPDPADGAVADAPSGPPPPPAHGQPPQIPISDRLRWGGDSGLRDGGLGDGGAHDPRDAEITAPSPCRLHCEAALDACPEIFATLDRCVAHCVSLSDAEAPAAGQPLGADTLACRADMLARGARFEADSPDRAAACAAVGPTGGGLCGGGCAVYCRLAAAACPGLHSDLEQCQRSCRQWPDDHDAHAVSGHTVWCRAQAAARALAGDPQSCAAAAIDGGGLCAAGDRCAVGVPCGEDRLCQWRTGACEALGQCVAAEALPCGGGPVCGCDGVTWPDRCAAAAAGSPVAHLGPCPPMACDLNADCPGGSYCARAPGACGEAGRCAPQPQPEAAECEAVAPICGCDGVTYQNACAAGALGVSVAHEGPCPPRPCMGNRDCGYGQWCGRAPGQCGGLGTCAPLDEQCADQASVTLCGCDRRPYPSACAAAEVGVSVRNLGDCPCERDGQCAPDHRCVFEGCGAVGTCQPQAAACPLAAPEAAICGCDGRTWPSRCAADLAGVDVAHRGACPASACAVGDAGGCPEGQICQSPQGRCRGAGRCVVRPRCPESGAPVCGCDGQTWPSACEALAAGISVAWRGACARPCDHAEDCGPDGFCRCEGEDCAGPGRCQPCTAEAGPLACGGEVIEGGLCAARDLGISGLDLQQGRCGARCEEPADCGDCACCVAGQCVECAGAAGCAD